MVVGTNKTPPSLLTRRTFDMKNFTARFTLVALLSLNLLAAVLPANAQKEASGGQAKQSFTKMTGMDTNVSVRLVELKRLKNAQGAPDNIVLCKWYLKKVGENKTSPVYKGWFEAIDVKGRNPNTSEVYEVARRGNTYSNTAMTNEWRVGDGGEGFCWLKVPAEIKSIDVILPYTAPFQNVLIN
jgi:hypothetical protein